MYRILIKGKCPFTIQLKNNESIDILESLINLVKDHIFITNDIDKCGLSMKGGIINYFTYC